MLEEQYLNNKLEPKHRVARDHGGCCLSRPRRRSSVNRIFWILIRSLASEIMLALVLSMLVSPAAALEPAGDSVGPRIHAYLAIKIALAGCFGGMILIGGRLSSATKTLLAPVMGSSSVLFVMLRNDGAIKADAAWIVFGVWATAIVGYLCVQAGRLVHFQLYMITSMVLTGICICIIAMVQKASLQGGLVTAIPPCMAFSAYTASFTFRQRRINDEP